MKQVLAVRVGAKKAVGHIVSKRWWHFATSCREASDAEGVVRETCTSQQHPASTRSRWSTHVCSENDNLANGHLSGTISNFRSLQYSAPMRSSLPEKFVPTAAYARCMSSYCSASATSEDGGSFCSESLALSLPSESLPSPSTCPVRRRVLFMWSQLDYRCRDFSPVSCPCLMVDLMFLMGTKPNA